MGRQVVDTYYGNQRKTDNFKACAAYADFRELLEQESDLDAVKIMTPDHLHATIAIAAMNKGKHVQVHKPLANRLHEARLVIETARKTQVATHLLAYGSGSGNAAIAARVKQGVIGTLREVHNWTNRPVWPQYTAIPKERPPVPQGLDWDLGWARRSTGPSILTIRIRFSAAGTISAAARWRTWGSIACGPSSPSSAWKLHKAPRPGRPTRARSRIRSVGPRRMTLPSRPDAQSD